MRGQAGPFTMKIGKERYKSQALLVLGCITVTSLLVNVSLWFTACPSARQSQPVGPTPTAISQHKPSVSDSGSGLRLPSVQPLQPIAYNDPSSSALLKLASSLSPVTDKVGRHQYHVMYAKYLEAFDRRFMPLKVLEIGLGCDMHYGPGASAQLWVKYMPNAEIWFAEYDGNCVNRHKARLDEMGVKVVVGDQADNATLARWVQETGGGFDLIIDDGGHSSRQMYNSFATLFHQALKPGGLYAIEDLECTRTVVPDLFGAKEDFNMVDIIISWLNSLTMVERVTALGTFKDPPTGLRDNHVIPPNQMAKLGPYTLPEGVMFIDCMHSLCMFGKCIAGDVKCPVGYTRPS